MSRSFFAYGAALALTLSTPAAAATVKGTIVGPLGAFAVIEDHDQTRIISRGDTIDGVPVDRISDSAVFLRDGRRLAVHVAPSKRGLTVSRAQIEAIAAISETGRQRAEAAIPTASAPAPAALSTNPTCAADTYGNATRYGNLPPCQAPYGGNSRIVENCAPAYVVQGHGLVSNCSFEAPYNSVR